LPPAALPPATLPPGATPGRRGDAFDPTLNPNAPGAPRPLGTTSPSAPLTQDEQVGAPGGRAAGAPLDLSTLAGAPAADPSFSAGMAAPGSELPQSRHPSGTGSQVAALPPTDSPKDAYDLAYGYVLRKDYALAEQGFRSFLGRYPSDRLASDAQYWLGESLFQRQRYRDAAEAFLNVSTKYDTAARAPDALLRLGQALAAMGEKEAACASFGEVLRKYPRASVSVKRGVDRDQRRVRCGGGRAGLRRGSQHPVRRPPFRCRSRDCRVGRTGFDRAPGAGGALARGSQARSRAHRGHRRSRAAPGIGAR